MAKIIRSEIVEIKFNQPVTSASPAGVTVTVHGAAQSVILSGSGTNTLRYTVQRAIFRHAVTWAYDGLGDITAVATGEPLGAIPEMAITNLLPTFTVWDYNAGAVDANTDTTWDADDTRFDET